VLALIMSLNTKAKAVVPTAVPSDFYSYRPCGVPPLFQAVKYSMLFITTNARGNPSEEPGLMSISIVVPAEVPSVDQSSLPSAEVMAEKYKRPLKTQPKNGKLSEEPG
jgi:hypothetical protein